MPLYLVRGTLPGARAADLQGAADRAGRAADQMELEGFRIRYLHSTYVPLDGWFGCLYEADSARDVRLAQERAAIPFDEVLDAAQYTAGPHTATPRHSWEPT